MDNRSSKTQLQQHRRQPALGKSMPVTALLLNLDVTRRSHDERGVSLLEDDEDEPPRYFAAPVDLQEPPSPGDSGSPDPTHYAEDLLLGNLRNDTPCLNCSQSGSDPRSSGAGGIINEMCQLLCNEECRQQGLSLCGQQIRAQDAQHQQQEQLHAAFLKQYEIAEALAKTSAMTSTSQMKQRLAARKLEMEIETQAAAAAGHEAARLATPRLEIDIDDAAAGAAAVAACSTTVNAAAAGDTVPPSVDHEMPPPRDLLLYLVR